MILTAKIDGNSTSFIDVNAQKYSDIKDETLFGYNYHIYNLATPCIYIEAYDSSMLLSQFDFEHLDAKYAFLDSTGKSNSYNAIDGSLNIDEVAGGVIYGNYKFTFVNILDNQDTLSVTDGYFEISLEYYDREWD